MKESDRAAFAQLLSDVMAFYAKDVSKFAMSVWWQACQGHQFEIVSKALTAHAMDPDRGQFAPKPADVVRQLHGTTSDRSLIAWGKVLDAAQRVGAYTTVCFDDGMIHAAIEDCGGWVAVCRTNQDELSYLQKRFCDSYRAYSGRPNSVYPAILPGAHAIENAIKGYSQEPPTLIGDPDIAARVIALGSTKQKTQITHAAVSAEGMIRRIEVI